jgi:hypothetical protein
MERAMPDNALVITGQIWTKATAAGRPAGLPDHNAAELMLIVRAKDLKKSSAPR